MSALAKLKARLEQQAPDSEMTKPTKPPSVGFVSTAPGPFSKNSRQASANDPIKTAPEVLSQFRFDLVEAEIAAGHPAYELNRANDLAWHFMQQDGLPFKVAIHIAADIVVHCDPAPCEVAYESAMDLWKRVTSSG